MNLVAARKPDILAVFRKRRLGDFLHFLFHISRVNLLGLRPLTSDRPGLVIGDEYNQWFFTKWRFGSLLVLEELLIFFRVKRIVRLNPQRIWMIPEPDVEGLKIWG